MALDDLRLPAPPAPDASPEKTELLELVAAHRGNLSALARTLSTSRSRVRGDLIGARRSGSGGLRSSTDELEGFRHLAGPGASSTRE